MADASQTPILYPLFAMVLLVAIVLMRMRRLRFAAVRSGEVSIGYYRAYQEGDEPEALRVVSRHFINLFEMPVLFYVGTILVYITHSVSTWMVLLAWLYVALRYVHSYVHLGSNDVRQRVTVYFASAFVLALSWASLFVKLVFAGD
jgi:hypothetical protein